MLKIKFGDTLPLKADSRSACDFIIETVRNNPNEVTLVAVGRLTNLALAIQKAPDIIDPFRMLAIVHTACALITIIFQKQPWFPRQVKHHV